MYLAFVGKPAWVALLVIAGPLQGTVPVPTTSTIPTLLQHLRAEIGRTITDLPDISCEESLRSTLKHDGHILRDVTQQAVLHVHGRPDAWGDFTEEREVIRQNGKPVRHGKLRELPFILTDGFGTTFATFLGADYQSCNRYELLQPGAEDGSVLVLQVTRIKPTDPKSCAGLEPGTVGVFWIDGHTYQIQRFGVSEPDGGTFHGPKKNPLSGQKISVDEMTDYHLVALGPKLFLLPNKIHAHAESASGKYQLGYDASFTSCHLYSVTVKFLDDSEAPQAP